MDTDRTRPVSSAYPGISVGLLHRGERYPDDLSQDGVIYHYPETRRPGGRDISEIEATKAVAALQLPVFVITSSASSRSMRDVERGWVVDWDDATQQFLVLFGNEPPEYRADPEDEGPFNLVDPFPLPKREAVYRPNQARFRFQVLRRYSGRCALCHITAVEILDAIHLRPKHHKGSDDPRNGLVLCASHHRAMEAGLFGIEPTGHDIVYLKNGPTSTSLGIEVANLSQLPALPHESAIQWAWKKWQASIPPD